jgi:hypothetical protein
LCNPVCWLPQEFAAIVNNDDLRDAARLERSGDDATALGRPAAGYYREAQTILLPAGAVWTDREAYDLRMGAFERIQQKLYALSGTAPALSEAEVPAVANVLADVPVATAGQVSVWDFSAGMAVRVMQDFRDYDGQEIHAGEVLHFIEDSYFFYEGGHTLRFAEKTIRLADVVDEHQPIIANAGNAWFQPVGAELL